MQLKVSLVTRLETGYLTEKTTKDVQVSIRIAATRNNERGNKKISRNTQRLMDQRRKPKRGSEGYPENNKMIEKEIPKYIRNYNTKFINDRIECS